MRRRDFIKLVGGLAVAWPLGAHAQQSGRRIDELMSTAADEPEGQARLAAFRDTLQQLGWTDGRNVRIDTQIIAGSDIARGWDARAISSSGNCSGNSKTLRR
jgi:putative tryptophan/tyrosine transport system substrate-binding protein